MQQKRYKKQCSNHSTHKYLLCVFLREMRRYDETGWFLLLICLNTVSEFLICLLSAHPHSFGGATCCATPPIWLVQRHPETLPPRLKWHLGLSGKAVGNAAVALRWWGRLIGKYKARICKIKHAADSYTNKVIMAQVLRNQQCRSAPRR